MKKFLTIFLALSMLIMPFGCGKPQKPKTEEYDMTKRQALNANEQPYTFKVGKTYKNYFELKIDGKITEVGDPFVMRWNGTYYCYPSARRLGVICFTSKNLVDWEYAGVVAEYDEFTNNGYAPEVVYYNGYFYMCESQDGKGHYLFRSESPLGPFKRISGNIAKGIDGSFFIDNDGQLYFMHTSTTTGLSYAKVNDLEEQIDQDGNFKENYGDAMQLSKTINSATSSMNGWTEGPNVFMRGDYYYLTYTGNHVSSIGYRVAYSYLKCEDDEYKINYNKFESLEDQNITLISTDSTAKSPGHSSDFVGPNLDSVYTAYHTHGPTRVFNLAQYFTNGAIVQANGYPDYEVDGPKEADFATENSSGLETVDTRFRLSPKATEDLYTAEFNFKVRPDNNAAIMLGYKDALNYTKIQIEGANISAIKVADGKEKILGTSVIPNKNCNLQALCVLRVENGYNKCYVTFNGMRLITLNTSLDAGRVGYDDSVTENNIFYTSYANDSFGTSDFEAVKNPPTSFPAYTYLKGENKGFYIKNAKVKANGVRQGEKENTVQNDLYTSVVLDTKEDYVKYAINAKTTGQYNLLAYVHKRSIGSIAEAVIDGQDIYKLEVPSVTLEKTEDDYVLLNLGKINLTAGRHTLKIRLFSGVLDVVSFKLEDKADSFKNGEITDDLTANNDLFFLPLGKNLFSFDQGLVTSSTSSYADKVMILSGNKGVSDYEVSVDIEFLSDTGKGGLVVRCKNYSYHVHQTPYPFQGYYVQFVPTGGISVNKYNYSKELYFSGFAHDEEGQSVMSKGEKFNVKVIAKGNSISLYVNETFVCTINDNYAFYDGYWGFFSEATSLRFSNLKYKEL